MPSDTKPPPPPTPITEAPKRKKPQLPTLDLNGEILATLDKYLERFLPEPAVQGVVAHLHTDELAALLREQGDVAERQRNPSRAAILRTLAKHLLPGKRYALGYSELHMVMCDPLAIPGLPGFTRGGGFPEAADDEPERVPFDELVRRQQDGQHVVG